MQATHRGSIRIMVLQANKERAVIQVNDALLIKGFGNIIFSLVTLEDKFGATITRDAQGHRLLNIGSSQFRVSTQMNVYTLAFKLMTPSAPSHMAQAASAAPLTADVWHQRLGHSNMRVVQQAAAIPDNGVNITGSVHTGRCFICPLGKSAQQAHPRPQEPARASKPCEVVMMDVYGPVPVTSLGGARYAIAIVDSYSRMAFMYTTATHDAHELLKVWRDFLTQHVTTRGHHVLKLRTDNAAEFGSELFSTYNKNAGIQQEFSSPYTPQQLGLVESLWKPLAAFVRMMIKSAHLPEALWAELMHTKLHIRNRVPMMSNPEHKSPYALWFGKEPSLSHLRIIGSAAFVHEERQSSKLEPRAWEGKLVGYNVDKGDHNSMSYRVFNASDGHVHVSRNVTFIEPTHGDTATQQADDGSSDEDSSSESDVDNDSATSEQLFDTSATATPTAGTTPTPAGKQEARVRLQVVPVTPAAASAAPPASTASRASTKPRRAARSGIPAPSSHSHNTRSRSDTSSNMATPALQLSDNTYVHMAYMATQRDDEASYAYAANEAIAPRTATLPYTHEQALQTPERDMWLTAEQEEIASLTAFGVYEWDVPPPGTRVHKSKWVYAHKHNSVGDIIRCKARFVACGYSQVQGQDYFDAFAPVARMSTYRACIAYAVQHDYDIRQLDVKTAFLQAELNEDIYVHPPVGYQRTSDDGIPMSWKLKRSLYGLVQAARCWYLEISSYLTHNDFTASSADPCLFVNKAGIILVLYVDDMIITGGAATGIQAAVNLLKRKYDIKDMGALEFCLGISVTRDTRKHSILLSQDAYVDELLRAARMYECSVAPTPEPLSHASLAGDDSTLDDTLSKTYRSIVGSLMYLATATRPDIAHAVTQLSKHMMSPSHKHMRLAKHVLRYLKGHAHALTYTKQATFELVGYVDADWAGDVVTRKSTTGFVFTLGNSAIMWKCKLQPIVATSTTYAEYIALSTAAQEAVALRRLFTAFNMDLDTPTVLYEDNAGAISISEYQGAQPERSKHIDVRYHYIRELIHTSQVKVMKIDTTHNYADMFTKALSKDKHGTFTCAIMGHTFGV